MYIIKEENIMPRYERPPKSPFTDFDAIVTAAAWGFNDPPEEMRQIDRDYDGIHLAQDQGGETYVWWREPENN